MYKNVKVKKLISIFLNCILRIFICLVLLYTADSFFSDIFTVMPHVNPLTLSIYAALGIPGLIAVYLIVWMGNL